jgi:hypothetical protein
MTRTTDAPPPPEPDAAVVPDQPRAAIINGTSTPSAGGSRYLQRVTNPGDTARLLVEYVRTTTPAAAAAQLTAEHPGGWREVTSPAAAAPGTCFCHHADGTWRPAFITQVMITDPRRPLSPLHYSAWRLDGYNLGRSVEYAYRIEDAGLHVYGVDGADPEAYGTTLRPAAFLAWHQPVNADTVTQACARLRQRSPRTRQNQLAGFAMAATIASLRTVAPENDLVLHLVTTTIRDKTQARTVRRALAKATGTTQARLPAHLSNLTRAEQLDLLRTVRDTLAATAPPGPHGHDDTPTDLPSAN